MKNLMLNIVLCCYCLFGMGCDNTRHQDDHKFGLDWNAERKARGIRQLPTNAVLHNPYEKNDLHWIEQPPQSSGSARWGGKLQEIADGVLKKETDIFYGVTKYVDPTAGTFEESLEVTYDFQKETGSESPWSIVMLDGASPSGRQLGLDKARSILETWEFETNWD